MNNLPLICISYFFLPHCLWDRRVDNTRHFTRRTLRDWLLSSKGVATKLKIFDRVDRCTGQKRISGVQVMLVIVIIKL